MAQQKEQDWILNVINNPEMNSADFKSVGLTSDNTSLLSESDYIASDKIQKLEQFQTNGVFDKTKFHNFYENATLGYNLLSNDTLLEKQMLQATVFGKDDIFAPATQRKKFEDLVQYGLTENRDRTTTGLIRINRKEQPKFTPEELAQTQQVLLNPVEAAKDPSKAIWDISPNDSWFHKFFDTRVLAQWDEDGEHEDPITGEKIQHKKGEYKINENGTYYYESLDGRDIYGRLVLNKMNTLTRDDSWLNKLDFFDSDGFDKSAAGTVAKNLALVGTMFVPYVGPIIAGTSVLTQTAGIIGTLGRMAAGSDTPLFNELEGWSKSVNRQTAKSQYAREHTWSTENFLNLIGDVAGQLRELRFLFEYAPALIKGKSTLGWNGISDTKKAKFIKEQTLKFVNLNNAKMSALKDARRAAGADVSATEFASWAQMAKLSEMKGAKAYEEFMKSYYKIGGDLSKAYMAAITTADSYGEFKNAGLSDAEAAIMTLGYTASELALLNTGVGEWILPELKGERAQIRQTIKTLTKEAPKATENNYKKASFQYWFNAGKNLAKKVSGGIKGEDSLAAKMFAGGLGEGVEETSEEVLADFWRGIADASQWLQGKDSNIFTTEGMFDRYAMSFVGGALGGGLTTLGTNFNLTSGMTKEQAQQQLIYLILNKKIDDVLKVLKKTDISDKNLSFDVDANGAFIPADAQHMSKDAAIKQAFTQQVDHLKNILNAEGLDISKDRFLDQQTLKDVRFANLQNSPVATLFLQDFLNLTSAIVKKHDEIAKIQPTSDSAKLTAEQERDLSQKRQELENLRNLKEAYLNGANAVDYISMSLMDLTPIFSKYFTHSFFKDYVEKITKRPFNSFSKEELDKLHEQFETWKGTEYRDQLNVLAPLYLQMARNSGMFIQEFSQNYEAIKRNASLMQLMKMKKNQQFKINLNINDLNLVAEDYEELFIQDLSKDLKEEWQTALYSLLELNGNGFLLNTLKPIMDVYDAEIEAETDPDKKALKEGAKASHRRQLIYNELLNNNAKYFSEFVQTGLINPTIKQELLTILGEVNKQSENNKKILKLDVEDIIDDVLNDSGITINLSDKLEDVIGTSGDFQSFYDSLDDIKKETGLDLTHATLLLIIDALNQALAKHDEFTELYNNIKNLGYTDVVNYIQNFVQTNSDSNLDIKQLLETVNGILDQNKQTLDLVDLNGSIDQIKEAIDVLGWLQGLTLGALKDPAASLDNMVGYNVTMNQIAKEYKFPDWEALPEISLDSAQIINQDINLIKNKLIQALNLYYINSGLKLALQHKVAMNKNFIEYNGLVRWIVNIDDSFAETPEAKAALLELRKSIEEAELLKSHAPTRNLEDLSKEDKENIEREKLRIDQAIFNFFNSDPNILKPDKLKEIFAKGFNFYDIKTQTLNEGTEYLNDRGIFNYLASRAAISKKGFNNVFADLIDPESGVAPIPTLEEAVFLNLAHILNGNTTNIFREAYIKALVENFTNPALSEAERKQILEDSECGVSPDYYSQHPDEIVNTKLIPEYSNIVLTQGDPGSGKSAAVDYYTTQVLAATDAKDKLLEKPYLIHSSKANADALGEKIHITNTGEKNDLMSLIQNNYQTDRTIDSEGNRIYNKDEFEEVDFKTRFKSDINDIAPENVPQFIIIDEISLFDAVDLQIINDFARKYGITVLASGDFNQSTILARIKDGAGPDVDIDLNPYASSFMGAPALGVSMRTGNAQLDKSILAFKTRPESKSPYNFYYHEDSTGLYGVKKVGRDEEAEILKLVDSANGEKLNLIYYADDSHILQLVNTKFKDAFNPPVKGTAAQGSEGKYFIVDFRGINTELTESQNKDLYTGITRAKQGVLVFTNNGLMINKEEAVTNKTGYSENGIKNYAQARKELLTKLKEGNDTLTYTPRSKHAPTAALNNVNGLQVNRGGTNFGNNPPPFVRSPKPTLSNFLSLDTFKGTETSSGNTIEAELLIVNPDTPALLVNVTGAKIPFYCKNGTWKPFWGLGTDAWINSTSDEDTYYDIPLLKLIGEKLDETYGNISDPANAANHSTLNAADINESGTDPMQWTRLLINETFEGVDASTTAENDINNNVLKLKDFLDNLLLTHLTYKTGDEITVTNGSFDGDYKVTVVPSLDGWDYILTDQAGNTKTLNYKDIETDLAHYQPKAPPAPTVWKHPNDILQNISFDGDSYSCDGEIVALENGDGTVTLVSDPDIILEVIRLYDLITLYSTLPNDALNDTRAEHEFQDKKDFNLAYSFYSFNTLTLGVDIDERGNIKFKDPNMLRYKYRIDSAIGLMKIFEDNWEDPQHGPEFYRTIIENIHRAIFNIDDKATLVNALEYALKNKPISNIEFGLFCSPNISQKNLDNGQMWGNKTPRNDALSIFDRHWEESSIGNAIENRINRKLMSILITLKNGKRVVIPLFSLGNINTLSYDPNTPIGNKLASIKVKYSIGPNELDFYEYMKEVENTQDLPQNIRDMAKLFNFTSGAWFKIDDPDWIPAKNLKNQGIFVKENLSSDGHFNNIPDPTPLKDVIAQDKRIIWSKQIYTSTLSENDPNSIAKTGHKFVLATTDSNLNNDELMYDYYLRLKHDPSLPKKVARIYVVPPAVKIKDYLVNLFNTINSEEYKRTHGIEAKRLGSYLTSYEIWDALYDNFDKEPIANTLSLGHRQWLKDTIDNLRNIASRYSDKHERLRALLSELIRERDNIPMMFVGLPAQTTLQELLNLSLLLTYRPLDSINLENLTKLERLIEYSGIGDVKHNPPFLNKTSDNHGFSPVESDLDIDGHSTYTIEGLDYIITGKVDPNTFSANEEFDEILHSFVGKIEKNRDGVLYHSTDSSNFINPTGRSNSGSQRNNGPSIPTYNLSTDWGTETWKVENRNGLIFINGVHQPKIKESDLNTINDWLQSKSKLQDFLNFANSTRTHINLIFKLVLDSIEDGYFYPKVDKVIVSYLLSNEVSNINAESSKNLVYFKDGKITKINFGDEIVSQLGFDYTLTIKNIDPTKDSIFTSLNEGSVLTEEGYTLIKHADGTWEINNLSLNSTQPQNNLNSRFDNAVFDGTDEILTRLLELNAIEAIELIQNMIELGIVDYKDFKEVYKEEGLLDQLDTINDPVIKDFISYLKEESENCKTFKIFSK